MPPDENEDVAGLEAEEPPPADISDEDEEDTVLRVGGSGGGGGGIARIARRFSSHSEI